MELVGVLPPVAYKVRHQESGCSSKMLAANLYGTGGSASTSFIQFYQELGANLYGSGFTRKSDSRGRKPPKKCPLVQGGCRVLGLGPNLSECQLIRDNSYSWFRIGCWFW